MSCCQSQDLYLPDLAAPKMISAKILKTFLDTHRLEILLTSNATLTKEMSLGRCPRKMGKFVVVLVLLRFFVFFVQKEKETSVL